MKKVEYNSDNLNVKEKERLVECWNKKHKTKSNYLEARPGDHLMAPFECEFCIFYKLQKRFPAPSSQIDKLLLNCLRRANLDVFWSRATSTVKENNRRVKTMIKLSEAVGLQSPFIMNHQPSLDDDSGYQVAVNMLMYSKNKGKYKDHLQFDTIRHLRSAYGNFVRSNHSTTNTNLSMSGGDGKYTRLSNDICSSLWFTRFMEGLQNRMGQDWRPNKALSNELLLLLFEESEKRIQSTPSNIEKDAWITFKVYCIVSYLISLRGAECFLLDLQALIKHWKTGMGKYVVIPLLGKIKGESGDIAHLIPCCETTSSGIEIRQELQSLINSKASLKIIFGPAICNHNNQVLDSQTINDKLHLLLWNIYQSQPQLFPPTVQTYDSIKDSYQCFRTFRKSSDTRALEKKIATNDIEIVNRWKTVEQSKGGKPARSMKQYYAQFDLLLAPFLRYTKQM